MLSDSQTTPKATQKIEIVHLEKNADKIIYVKSKLSWENEQFIPKIIVVI